MACKSSTCVELDEAETEIRIAEAYEVAELTPCCTTYTSVSMDDNVEYCRCCYEPVGPAY